MAPPERMRDSAFASNIPTPWTGAVAGYLKVGTPFHPWTSADWRKFSGQKKLPVAMIRDPKGRNAENDAWSTIKELWALRAKRGCMVVLDLEVSIDATYTALYGSVMRYCGFRVIPYGSASTLFKNPVLDGYWVAAPGAQPYYHSHAGVIMTQYALDVPKPTPHDKSTVRWSTWTGGNWWI